MVYTNLCIIRGIVVTKDELLENFDEFIEVDKEHNMIEIADDLGDNMEIFPMRCCSKNAGKLFIIGKKVHSYHRKFVRCEECKENTVCDKCIGSTNNGYFNVVKIHRVPVVVKDPKICQWCFHKYDSESIANPDDLELYKNQLNYETNDRCDNCGLFQGSGTGAWRFRHDDNTIFKTLNKYKPGMEFQFGVKTPLKFYLWIDDCLSCT